MNNMNPIIKSNHNVIINATDSANNILDVSNECSSTEDNTIIDSASLQRLASVQFHKQNNNCEEHTESVPRKNDDVAFSPSITFDPKGKKKKNKQKEINRNNQSNSSCSSINDPNIKIPIDHEARLLALAQRITMRQVTRLSLYFTPTYIQIKIYTETHSQVYA